MEKIITPFGEIKILIDGVSVSYVAQEGRKLDVCPHLLGRYQITVAFVPDGMEHDIACIFEPVCTYKTVGESGERLECQSFYNDSRFKLSIGLECETGSVGGVRWSDRYDYDAHYLSNGMSYHIEKTTKTRQYVFGIAWIDDIGRDDPADGNSRDVETWYGADPLISL